MIEKAVGDRSGPCTPLAEHHSTQTTGWSPHLSGRIIMIIITVAIMMSRDDQRVIAKDSMASHVKRAVFLRGNFP